MQVIYPVPFPLAVNVFPFISPSEGSDIVYVTPCVIEEEYPSESIPLNVNVTDSPGLRLTALTEGVIAAGYEYSTFATAVYPPYDAVTVITPGS